MVALRRTNWRNPLILPRIIMVATDENNFNRIEDFPYFVIEKVLDFQNNGSEQFGLWRRNIYPWHKP